MVIHPLAEIQNITEPPTFLPDPYYREALKRIILETVKSYGTLPEEVMGCSVEWNSSDESVITASGKVAAPPEKTKVELTAVITNGDTVLEHTYNVTVRPQ